MSVNKNVTFRRKHRPVWYGMLCLVLITAAAATVGLLPMQSNDLSSAESEGNYTLSGDGYENEPYTVLEDLIAEINNSTGTDFTITVNADDIITPGLTLNGGKAVTLISSSDDPFALTIKIKYERHFTVDGGATLTLENIILDGNKTGGGIEVQASGELIMKDGAVIQDCESFYDNGGGVHNSGTFEMYGGAVIQNCEIFYGNGGGVHNSGTFEMYGGAVIQNCESFNGNGGGVHNSGTFEMYGGEIRGNTAKYGGGVYNWFGKFEMDGGEIRGNTASYGGGVHNDFQSKFAMNSGKIIGNTAGMYGGGVHNMSFSTFTMDGGEISNGNTALSGGGVSNVSGTFTMDGGEISGNTAEHGGGVSNGSSFIMTGGVITKNGDEINGKKALRGGGVLNSGTFTMTLGEISGNIADEGGGVYNSVGTFIMTGGEISNGNKANEGGGVHNSGDFTMKGDAAISSNKANEGGGVYNDYGGEVTMEGGEISGNTAGLGGGVYITPFSSDVSIEIGKISDNTATSADYRNSSGGGIYTNNYSRLTVANDVVFSGNTAPTLRINNVLNDIYNDDKDVYERNIRNVVLDAWVNVGQEAPAYNNYDICYSGDTYIVFIEIRPIGGGTVNVTDSTDSTEKFLTKNGCAYVPISVKSMALSAEPETGYEFVQFILGKWGDDPTNVEVIGNMKIIAEFVFISIPSEDYIITATADSGSTITPNGAVEVPQGEGIKFTYSAKPGHRITAVLVDGVAISKTELASGEYTFFNVESNHTIHVESKADSGNGGTNPGGGDTGPGGNGGTNSGGGDTGTEGDDGGSAGNSKWAVLNLVCAIIAVFSGIVALIAGRNRIRKNKDGNERNASADEEEKERSKTALIYRALALTAGIVSTIAFFLTEDWRLPVVPIDGWTPLMFVLLFAALALTMASFGFDKDPEDEDTSIKGSG